MSRSGAIPWLPVLAAVLVLAAIPFAVPEQRDPVTQKDVPVAAQNPGEGTVPWSPRGKNRERQPELVTQIGRPVRTTVKPDAGEHDLPIPRMVLAAYRNAAERMERYNPACNLDWEILAGVGKVESDHARNGQLDARGNTLAPILGPMLDGTKYKPVADTDAGRYDGDTTWDRAVGPMQFLPNSWSMFIVDGNNDGLSNPHNMWDSAFAAAAYLCSGGTDLSVRANLAEALFRYNPSKPYVEAVLAWIDAYRSGGARPKDAPVVVAGDEQPPPTQRTPSPAPSTPTPSPAPTTTPTPSSPTDPTPSPTPTPTPAPTCLVEVLELPVCVELPLLSPTPG